MCWEMPGAYLTLTTNKATTMKTFLDSIKARADQAKATIAQADKLPALDAAVCAAKALGHSTQTQRDETQAALTKAGQAAADLRRAIDDAKYVLQECTPLLNAHADLATAQSAYAEAREIKSAALSDIANLEKLIGELNGEIAELSARTKQALTAHGQTSIAARLTGQQAPPTPKLLTTLSTDLESRKATLESAETMLASAQKRRDLSALESKAARDNWQFARGQVASIEYHDALASIAPQISMYLAATGYHQKAEFEPGREAIEAARALLDEELEQVN
jgi:chromosome segregation ATPase